uniref:Retrotransposon gag domain-containing protein n=1 Tax=Phaseolus vulgaris TaxID=3885 RepID=V7B223_PHAVU|nr:hypothetical protein PHAVU_009G214900g [Phaseolus vulgaris]ESW10501.1 hypothetical protein PHAVU_009G214900g [Phaseolus vulgaris]
MAPKKQEGTPESKAVSSSCPSTTSSSSQSTSTSLPVSSSTSPSLSSSTTPPVSSSPSPPLPSSTSASTLASTSVSASTSASATSSTTTSSSISASVTLTDKIPIKLDGKNYLAWSEKPVIPEQYASESDRTENIETEEYRRWIIQDQMLLTWLLSSIGRGVAPIMAGYKYSWQVWDTVKEHFQSHLRAMVRQHRLELRDIRKENRTVSEYVDKIQFIADSLAETGFPLSTIEHVEVVLRGLPRQYKAVITLTRTLQSFTEVTVSDIQTWLLILEEKFRNEYRYADGGGGPSNQDNAPSCSSQCSTGERGRGSRRRRGQGRGGRRRGRN